MFLEENKGRIYLEDVCCPAFSSIFSFGSRTQDDLMLLILLLLYYQSKMLLSKGPESEVPFFGDFRQKPIGKNNKK